MQNTIFSGHIGKLLVQADGAAMLYRVQQVTAVLYRIQQVTAVLYKVQQVTAVL
jgi:hypothetical protein